MTERRAKLASIVSVPRVALAAMAVVSAFVAVEMATATSCAPTPVNTPLRSFEAARFVDVVCMQTLSGEDAGGISAIPLPQASCTPVPAGVTGAILPNHLFALVTQTLRGEVAVVDLTAGVIVDEDLGSPGVNFLQVGKLPSGIASAPDGKMTYVASADINMPAIYALPYDKILGNSQQLEGGPGRMNTPPTLTTWPVCALPQTPGPITIIPRAPEVPVLDGGADAGSGGGGAAPSGSDYVLAVVLSPNGGSQVSRLITIDPRPLLRGAHVLPSMPGDDVIPQGSLKPCPILGETPLGGGVAEAGPGPTWSDGVKYLDAAKEADIPAACNVADAGTDATKGTAVPGIPNPAPIAASAARAGQYLYVTDAALPLIHVFDLSTPTAPHELAPLRATSLGQPGRQVVLGALAVSPPTRDYQRFLYAVDMSDNPSSIIVYDVTDPVTSPHEPLRRPHSALNPLEPEDRINFNGPVVAVAFVQHDWPLALSSTGANISGAAGTGLLCNPNPNVDGDAGADASPDAQHFTDPGANYRNSSIAFADEPLGPTRLRGIFGFATLSNGQVMTIDVDDWDAPCRRPAYMGVATNAIAPPEPSNHGRDGGALDPYEAPDTGLTNGVSWVSQEVFFPVSAPHRARSEFPLRNDPTLGIHYPYLVIAPQLYAPGPDGGIGAALSGSVTAGNPVLLPTKTKLVDPTGLPEGGVGIRIGWEDPTAHIDQNWSIDYEGKLPTFQGISVFMNLTANLPDGILDDSRPKYEAMFLAAPGGGFCSKGVEDFAIGRHRAQVVDGESMNQNLALQPNLNTWLGDYVQVADDLLPPTDPYWSSDPGANAPDDCWADMTTSATGAGVSHTDPTDRYNTCQNIFGYAADESISRDFPIYEAYDDGFVVTRFNYPASSPTAPVTPTTSNRQVTPPHPTNVQFLKQLKCCFHGEMTFNVRAGGEWVTVGGASGYLHHMTLDSVTNRCVTSCDPEKALLNARVVGIAPSATADGGATYTPGRDSVLAMRNPMFAFFMQHPFGPDPNVAPQQLDGGMAASVVQRPPRDSVWQFGLKGELTPLSINLAATNTSVSPQSMLFIPSLGQLAIVDGAQEGLILVDLNTVALTGNTFF